MSEELQHREPEAFRRIVAAQRNPLEIRMANVPFEKKIDVLAATLQSIRLAHRDEISPKSWALLTQVEHLLSEAVFYRNDRRMIDASKPSCPFLE